MYPKGDGRSTYLGVPARKGKQQETKDVLKASYVGGRAVWHDSGKAPSTETDIVCGVCRRTERMAFVAKVYAPTDLERSLYLFCCNTRACSLRHEGWKVVRNQDSSQIQASPLASTTPPMPSAAPVWKSLLAGNDEDDDELQQLLNARNARLRELPPAVPADSKKKGQKQGSNQSKKKSGGNLSSARSASNTSSAAATSTSSSITKGKIDQLKEASGPDSSAGSPPPPPSSSGPKNVLPLSPGPDPDPSFSSGSSSTAQSYHAAVEFPMILLDEVLEPWEGVSGGYEAPRGAHEEALLQAYLRDEDDLENIQALQAVGIGLAGSSSHTGRDAGAGGNEDEEEDEEDDFEHDEERQIAGDASEQAFLRRVSWEPRQVLRYAYEGLPLWISNPSPVSSARNVPPCEQCGAARVFECQLMPAVLSLCLDASKEVAPQEAAPEERKVALQDILGDGLDFGVVAIFSCPASCTPTGKFATEVVLVQPPPDISGQGPSLRQVEAR